MTHERIRLEAGTGRAVVWLARQVELVLADQDLSLAQYRILAMLEEQPEVASALAEKLAVSRPSITAVADGLAARGLIERRHDSEDRRRVHHAITPRGRRVLTRADGGIESGMRAVLEHLDHEGARGIAAGFASLRALTKHIAGDA